MSDGGSFYERWRTIGVDAFVDDVRDVWVSGRADVAYHWSITLVRTLLVAGTIQTIGEEKILACEAAVRASTRLRRVLEPLDGFAERVASSGFSVISKTFLRSLRLRVLDACCQHGRDLDEAGRSRALDRAALHARNSAPSCLSVDHTVCRGGGARRLYRSTPELVSSKFRPKPSSSLR
mmetsp:Transcript_27074/g.83422  ORF Transcript_27074/g.83422 Transcript_27074/m.83422 type:complete len:179 (-) Transcript_27074:501-1037(-)